MSIKRITLFYIFTLLVAGTAIVALLRVGASLPAPAVAPAEVQAQPSAAEPPSAVERFTRGLRDNLDDNLSHLLIQLLVIIATARLIGTVFRRIGQPAVVGEMAAGILLGPSLFGWLAPSAFAFVFPQGSLATLRLFAQVGVCFFMFSVGMELDVKQVRSRVQAAIAVSHASIVLPYVLGVVLAYFLYSQLAAPGATFIAFALFMGISMSITAFPVLARILKERRLTRTFLGSTALTCAAVGDVTAWCILAFVVAVATAGTVGGAALNLVLVVIFVTVMVFGVRRALPRWLGDRRMAQPHISTGTLAVIVCIVVASALTTEIIGIHALFGAFLAGAIVPDAHDFRHKVDLRVEYFSTVLLLPLFFAFTGLRTQVGLLGDLQGWLLCAVIIVVATAGKLGGSALAARFAGMSWRESLQLGALMNTRGLMELIALNIGYDLGILSPRIFTMLVIMALATTMLTGPLLTLFGERHLKTTKSDRGRDSMVSVKRPILGAVALLVIATNAFAQQAAWPRSTAEKEGLKSAPLSVLTDSIRSGKFGNVDRLVVVKNGKLVLSERFARDYNQISKGQKSAIGCGVDACKDSSELHEFNYLHPIWHPFYKGRPVHTLQSVSKSVSATLIGIAIGRGEIKSVNEPLLSFFDKYDLSKVDLRLRKATLADLLTMRSGIEWHEVDRPLDETNTTLLLERSSDWISFTLNQPMDAEPGQKWAYSSGGSALMAEIIRKSTGQQIDKYAEKYLFGPLGIRDYHWKKTPTGLPDTEGGLYLEAEDLARIGQLYLNDGMWNGKRILPANWAREATARHVANVNPAVATSPGYGYQWWRDDRRGVDVWSGKGFGGQFLIVVPAHNMVAVANSWNVFGARTTPILVPLIDALLDAVNVPR